MKLDPRNWLVAALGAAVSLLAACGGGGVDTGGTGAPLAFTSGSVTGFGSVIVNGVRFDDRSAEVLDDDGARRSRDDLRLGMSTEIDSSAISTGSTGATATASRIRFGSEIVGRVDAKDAAGGMLTVIGQTVRIRPSTVFDDSLAGGLSAVNVGSIVEIYARFDPVAGAFDATRIEPKGTVSAYRLRGLVRSLDRTAKTFRIGTQTISYAGLASADIPSDLANGRFAKLRLETAQQGGAWIATRMDSGSAAPEDRAEARVEGRVSSFTSSARFSVDGIAVDASAATVPAGVVLGAEVEVEGSLVGGVLVARKVSIETEDEAFELHGAISALDKTARTFVLRGISVRYDDATEFKDLVVGDLADGLTVEVRGALADGGTTLLAERIEPD